MEHRQAVELQAAERYVLGELPRAVRDQFEEHFFDCQECAREVRACAAFLANARAALAEQTPGESWSIYQRILAWRWLAPTALAACLVLLAGSGYLALIALPSAKRQLAALTAPQPYPAVFLRPVVRGEDQVITVRAGQQFVGLAVDVPPVAEAKHYQLDLFDPTGALAASVLAAPERPGAPLNLLLACSRLRPGRHSLVLCEVRAGAQQELNRFQFLIQFE